MTEKTIFKKILDDEITVPRVYEDDRCIAFRDISPQAPVHILVIPRKEIASIAEATVEDEGLLGHLLLVCQKIAQKEGLDKGYRIVINTGEEGGQTVFHLHVHILGRRLMTWPPG